MALKHHHHRKAQSGMTIIEMMVVLAIVAFVSSIIVFNYSGFRSNVTLRGLAQDIALSIRKAQTYATSVRAIDGVGGSTNQFPAYGISFSVESDTSVDIATPSKRQFVLFADIPDGVSDHDGQYNKGSSCGQPDAGNECLESFTINSADRIVQICTNQGCQSSGSIDVVFDRPAPDAAICLSNGSSCQSVSVSYLSIMIQGVNGAQRTITVWNTGQISVQ